MIIEKLKEEHKDILAIANKISADMEGATDNETAKALLETIGQLGALLVEHLEIEDDYLYPILAQRPQQEVRETASRLLAEIEDIKKVFLEYVAKWDSPETIVQSHSGFMSESQSLIKALGDRIAKENSELFPLADESYS